MQAIKLSSYFDIGCIAAATFVIALVYMSISLTLNQNWLGLSLQVNNGGYGIKIIHIHNERLKSHLSKNDIVIAIGNQHYGSVAIDSETLRPRASIYSRNSASRYLAVLRNEGRLHEVLQHQEVTVTLIDGTTVAVPVQKRQAKDLPINFWLQIFLAVMASLAGFVVYLKQREEIAVVHFLVSLSGFFVMACSWSVIMNRSIGLSAELYQILDVVSHLGISMLISGLLCMVWCYPRRLTPYMMPIFIYPGYGVFWLIDSLHLIDSLAFAFYSPMFFGFALITVFAIMQWQVTAHLPADRTILKWVFFFIYSVSSLLLLFVFLPRMLISFTLVSPNIEYIFFLSFYIGIALVLIRYRMINLEFWWSLMWGAYFALTVSAFIYFILISTFNINSIFVLSLAIFLGVISFYPFRQWFKSRIKTAPQSALEKYLPTLVDLLFSARSDHSLSMQWESILTRIFNPITLTARKNPINTVEIDNEGTLLRVPDFQPEYAIELAFSDKGKRLFVNDDVQLAQTMYELTRKAIDLNQAKTKGATEERSRIVRDLHDDVGAKLITIIHRAGTSQIADLSRSALQDIRDIMSYLGGGLYELSSMLADWRSEADSRCEAAELKLTWHQTEIIAHIEIDSRTRMNLTRVVREAFTNSIKHAEPTDIDVIITYVDNILSFTLTDNGIATDIESFVKGRGLHNMQERMQEIDGCIDWSQHDPQGLTVQFNIKIERI